MHHIHCTELRKKVIQNYSCINTENQKSAKLHCNTTFYSTFCNSGFALTFKVLECVFSNASFELLLCVRIVDVNFIVI